MLFPTRLEFPLFVDSWIWNDGFNWTKSVILKVRRYYHNTLDNQIQGWTNSNDKHMVSYVRLTHIVSN